MDLHRTASLSACPTIVVRKFLVYRKNLFAFCKGAAVVDSMDLYENNSRRFARWMHMLISSTAQIQAPEVRFHVKENFEKNHDFQF